MTVAVVHRFGSFELNTASGRLYRDGVRVPLSETQSAILASLVTQAGQIVPKNTLIETGWLNQAVSDDSLLQAISRLRKALASPDGVVFIETVPNRGYRFAAPVQYVERHHTDAPSDAELAPYREFLEGRGHLYTLNLDKIRLARRAFEDILRTCPDHAAAHIGLANACSLILEASRIDLACDLPSLVVALRHARIATTLDASSGDAWSTLAFALYLHGDLDESAAAARKAIALEPDDWHHWLRAAFVSWGEDRIRAARRALTLCPGLALAHWLIATVLIARGAFDAALGVLQEGCAAQDAQATTAGSFPAVGLYLLRGLVLGAQQRLDAAVEALERELASLDEGQMYARECAANSWYTIGAIRWRQRRRTEAESAFARALEVAPAHLYTQAALGLPLPSFEPGDPRELDVALAAAVGLARVGRQADAAHAWRVAVTTSPLPSAGWLLAVEPLIDVASHPNLWDETLTAVRRRAF